MLRKKLMAHEVHHLNKLKFADQFKTDPTTPD